MNIISKRAASRLPIALTTIAVTSSLAFWGCYADVPTEPLPDSSAGSGGDSALPPSSEAGVGSVGGKAPAQEPVENPDAGSGGAENVSAATGGASPSSAGASTGGIGGLGGSLPIASGGLAGESLTSGGSTAETGGTHAGGSVATGGVGGDATGGTAGGTAGGGGGGGNPPGSEPICADEEGFPVPYDFSYGLASEYAFELSMNCDVGGYILPLVLADPEQLSQVTAFVDVATGWYRAEILRCEGEQTELGSEAYGLLPVSESDELSDADFDASMDLFVSIVSRHDGLPDGVSPQKKNKIRERIKSFKSRAVHKNTKALTRPLSEPDCVPTVPPEGGG